MGIFILNMKFPCLILWLGGVCTDNDANADDDGTPRTKHDCITLG